MAGPQTRCRKATLADLFLIIAATAGCLALARNQLLEAGPWWSMMDPASRIAVAFRLVSQLAVAWTVCYFPLRLRGPRPALSEVFKQPGMVACSAACLSMLFGALLVLPTIRLLIAGSVKTSLARVVEGNVVSNFAVAHAVVGAWMALWLSGSWKSEPGWIDGMGRALGVYWVLSLVFLNYQLLWP